MSYNAILEVPNVVVVSGPAGQSFRPVDDAAELTADFGRDDDRAIIRSNGDEWLKTAGVWAATGENFWGTLLAQGAAQVQQAAASATQAEAIAEQFGDLETGITLAQQAAAAAAGNAGQTAADRAQTGADRAQTGIDRAATGADAGQTTADRVATTADRIATGADRTQTGLDRTATGADAGQTAADRLATGADRIATAADVVLTHADVGLANAAIGGVVYDTTAAGIAATVNGQFFIVKGDGINTYALSYKNVVGVATLIASYPSKTALDAFLASLSATVTQTIGRTATPVDGTAYATGTYVWANPVAQVCSLSSFVFYAKGDGTIKLKKFSKSGNVYTMTGSVSVATTGAGLKTLTASDFGTFTLAAGEYLGFYVPNSYTSYVVGTSDGAGYFPIAGDGTTVTSPVISTGAILQQSAVFSFLTQVVTAAAFNAVKATADAAKLEADNHSVSIGNLNATLSQHLGRIADPITTTGGSSSGTYMFRDPVLYRSPLTSFKVKSRAATNIKIKQLRLDQVTGTYTEIASVTVTAGVSGTLNTFTPADFGVMIFEAGDYLGYNHTTAIGAVNPETFVDGGIEFVGAGDITSFTLASSHNGAGFTYQVNADFGGSVQIVNATQFAAVQATVDALAVGVGVKLLGRSTDPIAGGGTALNYTDIQNTPAPYNQVLKTFKAWFTAANAVCYLRKYTRSGSPGSYSFTQIANVALRTRAAGLNTFTKADFGYFPVAAGEFLGIFAPTSGGGQPHNTASPDESGDGFLQVAGEAIPLVTTTPLTAYRMEWQFGLVRAGTAATADNWDALVARVAVLEAATTPASTLLSYGDSMTAGSGGTPYPTQLATLLSRGVSNRGVGANRGPDAFSRWGSFPVLVPALTIPTSGSVDFTVSGFNGAFDQANPITENNPAATFSGILAGVPGVLSRVSGTYPGSYVYRFTRTGSGAAVSVIAGENFFIDMSDARDYATPIFWVGRNSIGLQNVSGQTATQMFDKVIAWHERAIALLRASTNSRKFLIMGPSNRNDEYSGSTATVAGCALTGSQSYDVIVQIENELRQKWPRNFVNQRGYLVSKYDSGTPQDVIDFGRDVPPSSKRSDLLHYNTSGYGDVAAVLQARILQLGY
ncbi:hypothetical protein NKH33_07505 [Mesorhizobium sp. M1182]|uniref:hypothetical protein n=1 Tax=Mesorhizobium sp. M1182 TaxID=2957067 RepID=UPI00333D83FD